jgi:hypothetical protein
MSTLDKKKVDLVIAIDTSNSMKDEAKALNSALAKALKEASKACPSDIRIEFLGIEGTFPGTKFDKTVRDYLIGAGTDLEKLKGREFETVHNAGAQEDLARAVEDLSNYFDWREGAERNVFVLGDESLEGGEMVLKPARIKACDDAIATALKNAVKVHSYLGTPSSPYPTPKDEEANINEYKRLALRTGGEHFIYTSGIADFTKLLKDTICASKIPQEERIDEKQEEVDKLEGKPPAEKTKPSKPTDNSHGCGQLCEKLPEIINAIDTLNNMLKELKAACESSGPDGSKKGCGCNDSDPTPPKEETTNEKPPAKEAVREYTDVDEIYAITYYDNNFPGNQSDNGDIYVHKGGTGTLARKAIDNQHGSGWSNATTSDGTHYFGWKGDQIYRQKEGGKFEFLKGLSGGKAKDAFAFRKDDTGFFFSAYEGGKIYTFKHPDTQYSTVQVTNAAGNSLSAFSAGHLAIDIAFDADDRAYLLDSSGHLWRVNSTAGATWEAKYLCQFTPLTPDGEKCAYFGLAFDSHGDVYLAGGQSKNGQSRRFLAKSTLLAPDQVTPLYDGGWGSASYGNLSSRAYPKITSP